MTKDAKARALFGLSLLSSFFAWSLVACLYAYPHLGALPLKAALMGLMAPHMFRFVGLSFLMPGVVSDTLPARFARPAAWGDFFAACLAMIATLGFANNATWAPAAAWVFNVWGTIDLANAFLQGAIAFPASGSGPHDLGAAFFIPTFIVPGLLASHVLIFWFLAHAPW
ncbi:MAG: hypothetical protein M0T84_03160 [Betaproteobacteria bacterium]|nr:hypothetical protein [Betaproteobacteria bacterium]